MKLGVFLVQSEPTRRRSGRSGYRVVRDWSWCEGEGVAECRIV